MSATPRLPARVVRAIEVQRERGEILVSWVQAAIVALLATLYVAAPSTAPAGAVFLPVPWALGVYAMFTLFRLLRSHQRRMGIALCVLSVVVDIAVMRIR